MLGTEQFEGKEISWEFLQVLFIFSFGSMDTREKPPDLFFLPTYFPRPLQVRTHHRQNSGAKISYIRPPGKWIPWLRKLTVLKISPTCYSLPQIANDIYWDFLSIFYLSSNDLQLCGQYQINMTLSHYGLRGKTEEKQGLTKYTAKQPIDSSTNLRQASWDVYQVKSSVSFLLLPFFLLPLDLLPFQNSCLSK